VQAERLAAVGHAIATLSHHIKNILQGIRGGSYLIEEGLRSQDFEVCHKGWNIVEKNQDKISNLVMDMLTFGKEREPELVTADINETIADVIELMQVRAQQHEVSLQWRRSESVPPSKFDPDALHRAILNLVTNAVDACDDADDRRVKVSADLKPASEESPAMIHVVVEDTGRGIEHEDLVRIFNVFESRKGSRGTGLGLPVSLKILKEHGGDIAVESTPGKGSKFTVMLPYVESAPEDAESEKRWDDTRS